MVNKQIIFRLLNNIESYINDLEEIDAIKYKEYSTEIKTQRFVERTLHITIEAMFDIAHHIISDERLREPDSYADAFTVLEENKIISSDFLKTAKLIAQFRNKLVHYYEKIDTEMVFAIAKTKRSDFTDYTNMIKDWLNILNK